MGRRLRHNRRERGSKRRSNRRLIDAEMKLASRNDSVETYTNQFPTNDLLLLHEQRLFSK